MSDSLSQTIGNALPSLPPLITTVNRFLEKHAIPHEAIYLANLAIEEIVTNIIKYGYDNTDHHTIAVNLTLLPNTIHLQLKDDGHPFDPLQTPEPDLNVPLAQRKVGGLGLHLIREMVSHIAYRREDGINILEIDIARE